MPFDHELLDAESHYDPAFPDSQPDSQPSDRHPSPLPLASAIPRPSSEGLRSSNYRLREYSTSALAAHLKMEFSYTDFLQVIKYLPDFLDWEKTTKEGKVYCHCKILHLFNTIYANSIMCTALFINIAIQAKKQIHKDAAAKARGDLASLGLEINTRLHTLYSNFNVFKVFAIPSGSSTRSMYLLYNTSPNVLNFIPEIDAA